MKKMQKALVGTAIVGSVLGAGAFGVTLVGAASATTDAPSTTSTPVPGDTTTPPCGVGHGEGHHDGGPRDERVGGHVGSDGTVEELLTGDTAAKVTAAVLAEYPDATILRVETDADGAAYEAHITQGDGTRATVKLDESFAVTSTETGPGGGRNGAHDHPRGTEPGTDPDTDVDADADTDADANANADTEGTAADA